MPPVGTVKKAARRIGARARPRQALGQLRRTVQLSAAI